MDPQHLVDGLFVVLFTVGGAVVKTMWTMIVQQQQQIGALGLKLSEFYVPRAELQGTFERIFGALDDIRERLPR